MLQFPSYCEDSVVHFQHCHLSVSICSRYSYLVWLEREQRFQAVLNDVFIPKAYLGFCSCKWLLREEWWGEQYPTPSVKESPRCFPRPGTDFDLSRSFVNGDTHSAAAISVSLFLVQMGVSFQGKWHIRSPESPTSTVLPWRLLTPLESRVGPLLSAVWHAAPKVARLSK